MSQSEHLRSVIGNGNIIDADAHIDVVDSVVSNLANIGINFVAFDFDQTIIKIHTGGYWQDPLDELVQFVRPEMQLLIQKLLLQHQRRRKQQQQQEEEEEGGGGKEDVENNDDKTKDIHVAVVTFSSQPHVVRHVLDSILLLPPPIEARPSVSSKTTTTTTKNDQKQQASSDNNNMWDTQEDITVRSFVATAWTTTSGKIPIRGEDGSWKTPNPVHQGEKWWSKPSNQNDEGDYDDGGDGDDEDCDEDDYEGKQPHMVSAIQELEFLYGCCTGGGRGNKGLEITKSSTLLIDDDLTNIRIAQKNNVHAVWLDPNNPSRLFDDLLKLRKKMTDDNR